MSVVEKALKSSRIIEALHSGPSADSKADQSGVYSVKATDSLVHAFGTMIEQRITSLPVVDAQSRAVGFVDLVDILCFILDWDSELDSIGSDDAVIRKEVFNSVKAGDVMNFSGRDHFEAMTSETKIWAATTVMLEKGTHRIAVVRPNDQIAGVLSQLDVLRFLRPHIHNSPKGAQTVAALKLGTKSTRTASSSAPAKEAFQLIKKHAVSAVGVVDEEGRLIANLSATDLKIIGQDSSYFRLLNLPLKDLVNYAALRAPVTVTANDSLNKVIETFFSEGVHRIYVVDNDKKPAGVISPIDILAELIVQ